MAVRIAGHPVHPMLVHFPIAAWTATVAADLGARFLSPPALAKVGFVCEAAGLGSAALAMTVGFLDYAGIAAGQPAHRTATSHMLAMGTAWVVFLIALMGRVPAGWQTLPAWVGVADIVGFLVLLRGAQLGGTLVYRFGVGVGSSGKA